MRFKRRYFCIQIEFVDQVSAFQASKLRHTHLSDGIHESIEQFYGDYGVATLMPSFSVIFYNSVTHLAIVRAARDFQVEFHNLLTFSRKLGPFDVSYRVIHVSGSIRKCKQHLVTYCHDQLSELKTAALAATVTPMAPADEVIQVLERLLKSCETLDNSLNFN